MQPDLLRYSCQIALPGFSIAAQQQLQNAKVLIMGAGGLGCPSAQYLAAVGIGTVGIADFDIVSVSNLHRQILFTAEEVGGKKAIIACNKLRRQNTGIILNAHDVKITSANVMEVVLPYDMVLDCTDNFDTKYLLNDACVLAGKPLVYGAIYQYEGQVAIWNVRNADGSYSPNYRDVFPEINSTQIPDCAEGGVMPTLAGIIGCMQANEVIKYFTTQGDLLAGKILMFDSRTLQSRIIKLRASTKVNISSLPETPVETVISAKDLKELLDIGIYELIDVRTKEEHELFNIGGNNIPLHQLESNDFFKEMTKDIVVYCASGKRSREAVKLIKKRLPDLNIFSLEGGLRAWQE